MLNITILATGWYALTALLLAGFVARVLAGPRFSVLGQFATKVVSPRLGAPRMVPGPPKRFAQLVGVIFSGAALLAWAVFGTTTVAFVLLAVLATFAALESVVGFCAGCFVFGYLMRWGIVPEDTCEACNNIALRPRVSAQS